MTSVRANACIVGGGPAGLMLRLMLAKRDPQVMVLAAARFGIWLLARDV